MTALLLLCMIVAVGKDSRPATVAGALAARIREQKTVALVAIGVDAVANAVVSHLPGPKNSWRGLIVVYIVAAPVMGSSCAESHCISTTA